MAVRRPGHRPHMHQQVTPGKSLSPLHVCAWGDHCPDPLCVRGAGETTPGVLPALGSSSCEQCPREAFVTITWAPFTVRNKTDAHVLYAGHSARCGGCL